MYKVIGRLSIGSWFTRELDLTPLRSLGHGLRAFGGEVERILAMEHDSDNESSGSDQDGGQPELGGHDYCKSQYIKLVPVDKGRCNKWQCRFCSKVVNTSSVTRLWEHFLGKLNYGGSDITRCKQLPASAREALQAVREKGFERPIPTLSASKAKVQAKLNVVWQGAVEKLLDEFPSSSHKHYRNHLALDHSMQASHRASLLQHI